VEKKWERPRENRIGCGEKRGINGWHSTGVISHKIKSLPDIMKVTCLRGGPASAQGGYQLQEEAAREGAGKV